MPANNRRLDYLPTATDAFVFWEASVLLLELRQLLLGVFLGLGREIDVRNLIGHDRHKLNFTNLGYEGNSRRMVPGIPSERGAAATCEKVTDPGTSIEVLLTLLRSRGVGIWRCCC